MVSFVRQRADAAWLRAEEMQSNIWELTYSASVSVVGPFINVSAWQNAYLKNGWGNLTEYYCFNKNYEQVSLQDLFVDGYEYECAIMEKLTEAISSHEIQGKNSPEELYKGLQFYVTPSSIQFCTAPLSISGSGTHTLQFSLLFEEIGCHNMDIFSE